MFLVLSPINTILGVSRAGGVGFTHKKKVGIGLVHARVECRTILLLHDRWRTKWLLVLDRVDGNVHEELYLILVSGLNIFKGWSGLGFSTRCGMAFLGMTLLRPWDEMKRSKACLGSNRGYWHLGRAELPLRPPLDTARWSCGQSRIELYRGTLQSKRSMSSTLISFITILWPIVHPIG